MNLLSLEEVDGSRISWLIDWAVKIKARPVKFKNMLQGMILTMIFEKPSTRTRCSFEAGMAQMGGHAIYLDWRTTHLGSVSLRDEVKCIERYSDILMARVYRHEMLLDMGLYMSKPLINGISDRYHPCQVLGDLQTIREKKGRLEGLKLAYVGDGNNVCNSLIVGCSKVGMQVAVATPKGYEPLEEAVRIGGRLVHLGDDPKEACKDADVVYTDTWVSMGFEDERAKRLRDFKGFTVTRELLGDALFMHCLPVHRNEEASDEVIDSPQSIIFDQAENRLHMQKAILLWLLEKI